MSAGGKCSAGSTCQNGAGRKHVQKVTHRGWCGGHYGGILYAGYRIYNYYVQPAVDDSEEQPGLVRKKPQVLQPKPLGANCMNLYNYERDHGAVAEIVYPGADTLWDTNQNNAEKAKIVMGIINGDYVTDTWVLTNEQAQIVGFITYYKTYDYRVPNNPQGKPPEGFVYLLGVHQSHRRKGYASKLLCFAIDELAKQHVPIKINVQKNIPAKKLYEKMGFVFDEKTITNRSTIKGILDSTRYERYKSNLVKGKSK